ncbi:MAG: type 2 isopentenyl-diphosphate Delta-isomerase [Myxococcales bacterium]|nr:type 2 isopentenyl-diphosphate Delta-isomerase [Myxococcales bacterium]
MSGIHDRKADHIELCANGDVGFREATTLLADVRLVHDALPELDADAIDTSVLVLGKRLAAPLLIAAMTGGTEEAAAINRELAAIAEERQLGFGLGSQRAALVRGEAAAATYRVRDVAPTTLVLGNLGIVQASETDTADVKALVESVGADALCVHMNPAMELVQRGGDRDFRRGLETFARLAKELGLPIVAKETGCGIAPRAARALRAVGVEHVDVSGAGGTSWVAVETLRAKSADEGAAYRLGEAFWDWGIPTAASVLLTAPVGFRTLIATGGVATGLDVAKCLALGAHAAGIARPVLQALRRGGPQGARDYIDGVLAELRAAMVLTGSPSVAALRAAPRVILGDLGQWLAQLQG